MAQINYLPVTHQGDMAGEASAPTVAEETRPPPARPDRSPQRRWSEKLGRRWCPISSFFLANYHQLRTASGHETPLNSTEAMLVVHLMDYKWDHRAPFPTVKTLATRMGLSPRSIRASLKKMEDLGYIHREPAIWSGPNRYHLDGLFKALEQLYDEDAAREDNDE